MKAITEKRLEKINFTKEQRCNAVDETAKQSAICERIPHEIDFALHGFHDKCYTSFINLKNIRKVPNTDNEKFEEEGKG